MNLIQGLSSGYSKGVIEPRAGLGKNPIRVLWVGDDEQFADRIRLSQSHRLLSLVYRSAEFNVDLLSHQPTILVLEPHHAKCKQVAFSLIARVQWLANFRSILLTSSDRAQDRIAGYEAGADTCLSKPVNDVLLLAVLQQKWDRLVESCSWE